MKTRLASLLLVCLTVSAARADDWPQWRGPNRDDVSKEKGLLKSWPKDGPKLLWTCKEAGIGYSGPAIVGKTLYTMGAEGKKEYVLAIDVEKGKKLWSTEVGALFTEGHGDGPRCTPAVDGDRVYALGAQGDLICVEADGGKKVWSTSLKTDLGGRLMSGWGYSESPLVDGDKVICTPGGDKGTLAALDKNKGTLLWRSKGFTDPAGYSSVMPMTVNGVKQYVQMTGNSVAGVAADDGRLLWRFERSSRTAAVPTPLVRDNYVFATSGYGAECVLLKLSADGAAGVKCEKVYANHNMENQHGGVVLVGDYLYGHWGSNDKNPHHWAFLEFKSGDVVWESEKKDKANLEKGSITYADDRLYLYGEEKGAVVLLEANPKGWKEHGQFTLPEKSKAHRSFWTHPVVANGRLYIRDEDLIFCYDIKDSK
jgi:outer membrane protein assembly factor BamB